jgi:hypothetical protein
MECLYWFSARTSGSAPKYITGIICIHIGSSGIGETPETLATYDEAINASAVLAASIGQHFGGVAAETFRLLFSQQVENIDAIFVQVSAQEDATDAAKILYENGRRISEYLNTLTMLFTYYEASTLLKSLFDKIIRIPVDSRRSGLTYETINLDAVFDHTASVAGYFAAILSKYDRLKRYISRV